MSEPETKQVIDIRKEETWKTDPRIDFNQAATLTIAGWILLIFSGVYIACFVVVFILLFKKDTTAEQGLELIKFMIGSILPLVTLAVGYYLGDKRGSQQQEA